MAGPQRLKPRDVGRLSGTTGSRALPERGVASFPCARTGPGRPRPPCATLETLMSNQSDEATAGIGFGSALAMILSFQLNHSILSAIVHGALGSTSCIARGRVTTSFANAKPRIR
jgi:hypothetical protein